MPGYPDVTPDFFFFSLQLVHDGYYFAISRAYNSITHSGNKQIVMNFSASLAVCFIFAGLEPA